MKGTLNNESQQGPPRHRTRRLWPSAERQVESNTAKGFTQPFKTQLSPHLPPRPGKDEVEACGVAESTSSNSNINIKLTPGWLPGRRFTKGAKIVGFISLHFMSLQYLIAWWHVRRAQEEVCPCSLHGVITAKWEEHRAQHTLSLSRKPGKALGTPLRGRVE